MNNLSAMPRIFCSLILLFLLLISMAPLSACHAQQTPKAAQSESDDGYYLLDLVAFNYTDRYIDSYSVDGQGGGNVFLSSPSSGGSKVVCCINLPKEVTQPIRVVVRWQYDGCTYATKSIAGNVSERTYSFYKETEVDVSRAAGVKPKHLEVHFYQDGSVQVQLSESISSPHLLLNDARTDKSSFPRCKDDKKPV